MYTTSDGGLTWTRASGRTNENPERTAGEATNPKAVWYAGDQYEVQASGPEYKGSTVNVSLDGGSTWSASSWVAPIIRIVGFNQSAWVYYWPDNPDTGCMSGVSYTADGGQNWACTPFYYGGKWVWTIDAAFASETEGWLAGQFKLTGQYGLWRSTDGGRNWLLQRTYTEKIDWVEALDGQTAWVGLATHMERTVDGGDHWEELPKPASRPSFTSISRGWAHDDSHVYRTTDGGESWGAMLTEAPKPNAGWFLDHLTGWRAAGDRVERTTDGGDTWLSSAPNLPAVDGFQFVDPHHGWAWSDGTEELRRTTDSGATWTPLTPGTDTLRELQFVDGLTGWVTTSDGRLRRTIDGGVSWAFVASPLLPEDWRTPPGGRAKLDDVLFTGPNDGIALSSYCWQESGVESCTGADARTRDGGLSWDSVKVEPKTSLFLPDGKNGWGWLAAPRPEGEYFEVSHTSDAGASWKLSRSYSAWFGPNWLAARDGRQAWNGADDAFYASVNDGASWVAQRAQGRPDAPPAVDRLGVARIANGLFHRTTEVRAARAAKAPNLDGSLQDWASVPAFSFKAGDAIGMEGDAPLVLDVSMILRTAWDADTLYFGVQVYDDALVVDSPAKPWQDDSVETGAGWVPRPPSQVGCGRGPG